MTAADAFSALREEGARCRDMWAAVVARVLLDARRDDEHGAAARAWLARPDELVCEFAGLDAAAIGPRLRKLATESKSRTPTLRIER
jgi:hypothetical protein